MMADISQGDIVASDGRIRVLQRDPDRKRFIEFSEASVLDVAGNQVTVRIIGRRATLVAKRDDLLVEGEISAKGYSRSGAKLTGEIEESHETEPDPTVDEPDSTEALPTTRSTNVGEDKPPAFKRKRSGSISAASKRKRAQS